MSRRESWTRGLRVVMSMVIFQGVPTKVKFTLVQKHFIIPSLPSHLHRLKDPLMIVSILLCSSMLFDSKREGIKSVFRYHHGTR